MNLAELLRRPSMNCQKLARLWPEIMEYDLETRSEAESSIIYSGYLNRQKEVALRQGELEKVIIEGVNYADVHGLSREVVEKLGAIAPVTMGQAARISGITPAALNCIEVHLKKLAAEKKHNRKES